MLKMTEGPEIIHKDAYTLVKNEELASVEITSQLLAGSLVISSTYSHVAFSSCVFYSCSIKQVMFTNCTFNNCNFEFSHLSQCHFINCRFINCQWTASSSRENILEGCLMDESTYEIFQMNQNTIMPNLFELEEPVLELLAA